MGTFVSLFVFFKREFKGQINVGHVHIGGLADEVRDLLGELVGAADHHAVQGRRVLGDVDHDGAHLEDGRVVGLQPSLGAVQGLRLGDVALDHRSGTQERKRNERREADASPGGTTRTTWVRRAKLKWNNARGHQAVTQHADAGRHSASRAQVE